jgi:tetratricopeptide (TPR) repeat protein
MIDWHSLAAPAAGAKNVQAPKEAVRTSDIHRQLERICASTAFRGSLRLTRFLTFVVETTLAGKSDTIKAYTIAVEALDRGGNFNPESDPIVRVEAGRLRRALTRYYTEAGRNDVVIIDLPRGTYVPIFHCAEALNDGALALTPDELEIAPSKSEDGPSPDSCQQAGQEGLASLPRRAEQAPEQWEAAANKNGNHGAGGPGRWRTRAGQAVRTSLYTIAILAVLEVLFGIDQPLTRGENRGLFFKLWPTRNATAAQSPAVTGEPIIYVEPVTAIGERPPDAASSWIIRERLFDSLARYDDVTVVPDPPHEAVDLPTTSALGIRPAPPYYRLSSVANYYPDGNFTIAMRLIDTADGTIAWANAYDREPEQSRHSGAISRSVAQTLLQQFGVIQAREAIKRATANPMEDSYRCILDANAYVRSFDPSLYGPTRDCLERAAADGRPLVGVFAKLVRFYVCDYQFGGAGGPAGDKAALDRAYRMAVRAIDVKPTSAIAHFAMEQVLLARGDFEQAKVAGENALSLNPYDNGVIFSHALLLILTGQIDEGLATLRQNTNRKTAVWTGHHFLLALGSYLKNDLAAANVESGQIANENFAPGLMLDALVAEKDKNSLRALHDVALLYAKYPSWRNDPRANIGYFLPDRDMADRIGEDFAAVADDLKKHGLKKHADVVGSVDRSEHP